MTARDDTQQMRLSLLKVQRNSIKNEISLFDTFIDSYDPGTQFTQLQFRHNRLATRFAIFDQICDEITLIETSEENSDEKLAIFNNYFTVTSRSQEIISSTLPQYNAQISDRASIHSTNPSGNSSNSRKRKLQLPQIPLPKFSGDRSKWLYFKNTFISLVHDDDELADKDKFGLLQGACTDDAKDKIEGFLNAENDYEEAWETLVNAYESKCSLIATHLAKLLYMPNQDDSNYKSLEKLADTARVSMKALENLGVQIFACPEIVVKIIEDKLTEVTREYWRKECQRDEFPTLEKMRDFLYKTASILSERKSQSSSNKNGSSGPPKKSRKAEHKQSASTFVTATNTKTCPICSTDEHPLYRCDKFRDLDVEQKIKVVEAAKLCKNCLRKHGNVKCRSGKCKTCNKWGHNTLICKSKKNNDQSKTSIEKTEKKTGS